MKKNQWTDGQLIAAKEAVGSGMSIHGAALKYGILKSNLQDYLKRKITKQYGGPSTVLVMAQEK